MLYIEGPWRSREHMPQFLHEVAKHTIKDPVGATVATISAPYAYGPDTPTVEEHLNIWRNTARIITKSPDMYELLCAFAKQKSEDSLMQDLIRQAGELVGSIQDGKQGFWQSFKGQASDKN